MQVQRHSTADGSDAAQLEAVPDPPSELTEVEHQGGDQRAGEPGEPDDHAQIGAASSQ